MPTARPRSLSAKVKLSVVASPCRIFNATSSFFLARTMLMVWLLCFFYASSYAVSSLVDPSDSVNTEQKSRPVGNEDVYNEFKAIAKKQGITKFAVKPAKRLYAFDLLSKSVPREETEYLKVVYTANSAHACSFCSVFIRSSPRCCLLLSCR